MLSKVYFLKSTTEDHTLNTVHSLNGYANCTLLAAYTIFIYIFMVYLCHVFFFLTFRAFISEVSKVSSQRGTFKTPYISWLEFQAPSVSFHI